MYPAPGLTYYLAQIWDLRTGGMLETLKYDHAVTALQFDTRKVVAATGENGIKVRSCLCYYLQGMILTPSIGLQPDKYAALHAHN